MSARTDAAALAQAIEPLMRDPAATEAMGARARQRVLDKFSVEAEAKAINEVYRTLI